MKLIFLFLFSIQPLSHFLEAQEIKTNSKISANSLLIDFQNPILLFGFPYHFCLKGIDDSTGINVTVKGGFIRKCLNIYTITAYYDSEIIVSRKIEENNDTIIFRKPFKIQNPNYYISINGASVGDELEGEDIQDAPIIATILNLDRSFIITPSKHIIKSFFKGELKTFEVEGNRISKQVSDFINSLEAGSPIILQLVLSFKEYPYPIRTPEYVFYSN